MRPFGIKQTLHDLLKADGDVPILGMVGPVSGGIRGEGKVSNGISLGFVIELEEDAEASVRKEGVRRFGENVEE
jgi:hypothetical protein